MNLCEELCGNIKEALIDQDEGALVDNLRLLHAYVQARFATSLPLNCGDFDSFIKTVREAAETLVYKTVMKFIDGRDW
jgi:hypothetical protein